MTDASMNSRNQSSTRPLLPNNDNNHYSSNSDSWHAMHHRVMSVESGCQRVGIWLQLYTRHRLVGFQVSNINPVAVDVTKNFRVLLRVKDCGCEPHVEIFQKVLYYADIVNWNGWQTFRFTPNVVTTHQVSVTAIRLDDEPTMSFSTSSSSSSSSSGLRSIHPFQPFEPSTLGVDTSAMTDDEVLALTATATATTTRADPDLEADADPDAAHHDNDGDGDGNCDSDTKFLSDVFVLTPASIILYSDKRETAWQLVGRWMDRRTVHGRLCR